MTACARRDAGFTLVEMLIGLALLALMTALLGAALGGVRQAQRSHDRRTVEASVEPVESYLRRVLTDMRPVRQTASTTAALIDARGDRIAFVTGYGAPGGHAGLQRITLQLVETGRSGVYDLEEVRGLHRAVRPTGGEVRTRLLEGVAGWKLSYLGAARPRQAPSWADTWSSPVQVPQMITIEVVFPAGDVRRWTPQSIAIPAGQ